ncbi:MAG: DoxX family protein [Phycisphaerales bacterium]|nr:DoxX family protein [Phycisphaerales bacterium]
MEPISKPLRVTSWVLQIVIAVILGQTLFFKFTGAPETKALFEVLGAEPIGRYATACAELLAVVLLLIPRTSVIGAVVSLGVISGAILSHLTKLGVSIDPQKLGNPNLEPLAGPSLFVMAVIVLVGSICVLFIRRTQLPLIGPRLA